MQQQMADHVASTLSVPLASITVEVVGDANCDRVERVPPRRDHPQVMSPPPHTPASMGIVVVDTSHPTSASVVQHKLDPPGSHAAESLTSPSAVHVVASGGRDVLGCGSVDAPCATLRFAVNSVSSVVNPPSATVPIVMGPGMFGPNSCGANATRPVNVTGAGSGETLVDCEGTDRLLYTCDSLWLTGITVVGGLANVAVSIGDAGYGSVSGGGGGGVTVMWPSALDSARAVFLDVAFVNNSMVELLALEAVKVSVLCSVEEDYLLLAVETIAWSLSRAVHLWATTLASRTWQALLSPVAVGPAFSLG